MVSYMDSGTDAAGAAVLTSTQLLLRKNNTTTTTLEHFCGVFSLPGIGSGAELNLSVVCSSSAQRD